MLQDFMQIPMQYSCHYLHRTLQPLLFSTEQTEAQRVWIWRKKLATCFIDFPSFLPWVYFGSLCWILFGGRRFFLGAPFSLNPQIQFPPSYHLATKIYGFFPLLFKAFCVSAFSFCFSKSFFLNLLSSFLLCMTNFCCFVGWREKTY